MPRWRFGAAVEGKVTSTAGGAGIPGVSVRILAADTQDLLASVNTNSVGEYRFKSGFAPGDYVLEFINFAYEFEYFDNVEDFESATPVTIVGTQTKVVNAALTPLVPPATGVIKGRITKAGSGDPIPNARVAPRSTGNDGAFVDTLTADAQGYYTATVPVGTWRILAFRSLSALTYAPRFLGGDGSAATAEIVTVTANAEIANKNIALSEGWFIEGTIKGPGNVPLDLVRVSAYEGDYPILSEFNSSTQSDPDGSYTLGPLPPYPMKVDFFPSDFDCTLIDAHMVVNPPAVPTDTVTISPTLVAGSLIQGRVTSGDPSGGERNVQVHFINGSETHYASTSDAGYYLSPALPAASYKVGFFKNGFADLYYLNKPDLDSATPVPVVVGPASTDVEAHLSVGGNGGGGDSVFAPLILK